MARRQTKTNSRRGKKNFDPIAVAGAIGSGAYVLDLAKKHVMPSQGKVNRFVRGSNSNPMQYVLNGRAQFAVDGKIRTIADGVPVTILEKTSKRLRVQGNWDGPFSGWVDKDQVRREQRNPEDIDFLNDRAPYQSLGHIEFTPDGIERYVRDGYVYMAFSNTPVFEDGYRMGTPEESAELYAVKNPAKYERCVRAVQARGGANGYAVCASEGLRKNNPLIKFNSHRARDKAMDLIGERTHHWSMKVSAGHGVYDATEEEIRQLKDAEIPFTRVRDSSSFSEGYKYMDEKLNPQRVRRNPESTSADLYEQFHGTPSTEILEIVEDLHVHGNLGGLGQLVEMYIVMPGQYKTTLIAPNPDGKDAVQVCGTEDGNNVYFRGGDESIDVEALGFKPSVSINHEGESFESSQIKDSMLLGYVHKLTYRTEKAFDDFETVDYYHRVGEDTKKCPMLIYDTLNALMSLAGGEYTIAPQGIVN